MNRVKTIIANSLLTLVLVLSIMASVLVVSSSQAEAANQPTVNETTDVYYLPLTDAPPFRDISQQRVAPLQ